MDKEVGGSGKISASGGSQKIQDGAGIGEKSLRRRDLYHATGPRSGNNDVPRVEKGDKQKSDIIRDNSTIPRAATTMPSQRSGRGKYVEMGFGPSTGSKTDKDSRIHGHPSTKRYTPNIGEEKSPRTSSVPLSSKTIRSVESSVSNDGRRRSTLSGSVGGHRCTPRRFKPIPITMDISERKHEGCISHSDGGKNGRDNQETLHVPHNIEKCPSSSEAYDNSEKIGSKEKQWVHILPGEELDGSRVKGTEAGECKHRSTIHQARYDSSTRDGGTEGGLDTIDVYRSQVRANVDDLLRMGQVEEPRYHQRVNDSSSSSIPVKKNSVQKRREGRYWKICGKMEKRTENYGPRLNMKTADAWPTETEDKTAPLHLPNMGVNSMEQIINDMKKENWQAAEFIEEWLLTEKHHTKEELVVENMRMSILQPRLTKLHWEDLKRSECLIFMGNDGEYKPKGIGLISERFESNKGRYRLLLETISDNVNGEDAPKAYVRPIGEMIQNFSTKKYFGKTDWKCFYFTYDIPIEVAEYWAIHKKNEGWYVFTRGPMGHKAMVWIAHSTTQFMVWLCKQKFPKVEYDEIIDDVAYGGETEQEVNLAIDYMMELASKYKIETSKVQKATKQLTHRGIVLTAMEDGTATLELKDEFVKKATNRVEYIISKGEVTVTQMESIAGMMAWTTAATNLIKDVEKFTPFHIYRKLASLTAMSASAKTKINNTLKKELQQWLKAASKKGVVTNEKIPPNTLIVTDACKTMFFAGWGGVIVTPGGNVEIMKGKFSEWQQYHITLLEAMAIEKTIEESKALKQQHYTLIACDNQAVVQALKKGRSRSYQLHCGVKRILKSVNIAAVMWIPSDRNPTDGISRDKEWDEEDQIKLATLWKGVSARTLCHVQLGAGGVLHP